MAHYVEIVINQLSERGRVCLVSEVASWQRKAKHGGYSLYRGYYKLDDTALEHVKAHRTLEGYPGKYTVDRLFFNIDRGQSTDSQTLERLQEFLRCLMGSAWQLKAEQILVWFSGTGYHVAIPDIFDFAPSRELPTVVEATLKKHFGHLSIDVACGHDRLVRVTGTINPKSNRYKIPLSVEEAFSLKAEDILQLARAPRDDSRAPKPHRQAQMHPDRVPFPQRKAEPVRPDDQMQPLPRHMSVAGDPLAAKVFNMKDGTRMLKRFLTTDFSQSSIDLKHVFGLPNSYTCYPGEFVTVMGDTGVGKTALLQNVIAHFDKMTTLYLTLEVSDWLLARRFLQIKHGLTKDAVADLMRTGTEADKESLELGLGHIYTLEVPPTLESLARMVQRHQPRIVVVDTIDGINVPGAWEENAKMERIGLGLKELAQSMQVIVFGVHHISKGAAMQLSERGLTVHSGKGASTIEQKADKVIGIEGDRNNKARIVHSMKSRDESNFRALLNFEPTTFRFTNQNNHIKAGVML